MDSRDRTSKAIDSLRRANARDVFEHPIQDTDLSDAGDESGDELDFEEKSGWDFHVMAQFEVGGEFYALGGADVAVCDEDLDRSELVRSSDREGLKEEEVAYHVCDWSARKDDTTDQLTDEIETTMLICDSHDDADRNEKYARDRKSKEKTVPREVDWVVLNDEDTYC